MNLRRRLEVQLEAATPWCERDNLDVVAVLDLPTWATLVGLLDECPVIPTLEKPAEFTFISENRQVTWILAFAYSLPERFATP